MGVLRVAIDARLVSGKQGGVEQFIVGLAKGLSQLSDGDEEYIFLVYENSKDWLVPFLGGACRILVVEEEPHVSFFYKILKGISRSFITLWNIGKTRSKWKRFSQPVSRGIIEDASVDIIHFPIQQNAFITDVPSIYHPHDLQHIHLADYFSVRTRIARTQMFLSFCDQASMVAVASNFVKEDLNKNLGVPLQKIKVISLAPVVDYYSTFQVDDFATFKGKFSLPDAFLFYPAQTWAHKNHIGLLKALAYLRDELNLQINVVFSGTKNEFYTEIEKVVSELGLQKQISFLGFVTPAELYGLYKKARGVVIPTKFEAASFPLWESFVMGVPVACSSTTSLPAQSAGAALIFDPDDPRDMAQQIFKLWTDEKVRSQLIARGKENVSRFSWVRTASAFRAHYRHLAGRTLTIADKEILDSAGLF